MQSSDLAEEAETWRNLCRAAGEVVLEPQAVEGGRFLCWVLSSASQGNVYLGSTPEEATINAAKAALGVK